LEQNVKARKNASDYPEYHDPSGKTDYLSVQHIERYRFALQNLDAGQRVLDVACGAGYGTALLSEKGCEAVGVDNDEQLLCDAGNLYKNKIFINADALYLPFANDAFDAVLSFETIEHIRDNKKFLDEIYRVLRPGGIFICSTPNIRYTKHPVYHVKEYTPEEFYGMIEERFSGAEKYCQYFKFTDRLNDLYRWNLHEEIINILEKTGTKEFVKKIVRPEKSGSAGKVATGQAERADTARECYYHVRPFKGSNMLRIMVALARKGE
jgi:ubiquinone/menaquinone biosynthesis C-methylase UbiE